LTELSNLKGCQKVAGGRSPRRPPEEVISHDRTLKGCQTSLAFPVVSADSDHRLLSLQPFGLLPDCSRPFGAGSLLDGSDPGLAKPRPGLNSDRCYAAWL